ncbi:hypothetical protein SLA2020_029130 [Shorea laevis]
MKHIFKKLNKGHNHEPNRTNGRHTRNDHQRTMSGNSPTSPSHVIACSGYCSERLRGTLRQRRLFAVMYGTDYMFVGGGVPGSVSSSDQRDRNSRIRSARRTLLSLGGHRQMDTGGDREEVPAEDLSRHYFG